MRADHPHQVDVAHLVLAADVVAAAHGAARQHRQQRVGVILHVEPVADVLTLAVDGNRRTGEGLEDDHGDQLFGKVVGAVIVRAVGDDHRQAVGFAPGAHQMVAGGLGRGIGRVGRIGRVLGELAGGAEGAVHLIGGDMVEAEPGGPVRGLPVAARFLQQRIGAVDIGAHERAGSVDGAVHMAFGGQMQDRVGAVTGQDRADAGRVADVGLLERVSRRIVHRGQVGEARGIGQLVQVHDLMAPRHGQPHHRRADEARAARHQQFHRATSTTNGLSNAASAGASRSLAESWPASTVTPQSMARSGSS
ncbi:hypothetical protein PARU111607_14030 [Palleronia rufa]